MQERGEGKTTRKSSTSDQGARCTPLRSRRTDDLSLPSALLSSGSRRRPQPGNLHTSRPPTVFSLEVGPSYLDPGSARDLRGP